MMRDLLLLVALLAASILFGILLLRNLKGRHSLPKSFYKLKRDLTPIWFEGVANAALLLGCLLFAVQVLLSLFADT